MSGQEGAMRARITYSFSITRASLSIRPVSTRAAAVAVSAALAAALIASGCGSSDSETYSVSADTVVTTATIAKAGYVPRINAICRKAWPVISENFALYSRTQSPGAPERKRFESPARESLIAGIVFYIFDGIYNLGAPKGEEREVEKVIGTMQSASERGQKRLAPVSSVSEVADLYGEYNQRARRYGLDECLVDEARLRKLKLES
jgi:hypothetical protein